jgi:hypothetical protein
MDTEPAQPHISITPEPSGEELAAILAAVQIAEIDRQRPPAPIARVPVSRWTLAGRADNIVPFERTRGGWAPPGTGTEW